MFLLALCCSVSDGRTRRDVSSMVSYHEHLSRTTSFPSCLNQEHDIHDQYHKWTQLGRQEVPTPALIDLPNVL